MKGLVIYYSLEGHTKLIAETISKELKCDLLELKPEKEIPKKGFSKFLWGGKSVIFNEKPKLINEMPDLNQYDTLIIGTPIWAGSYVPAINTFLSENKLNQKKLAFFACHAGGGAKKCFDKFQAVLKDNTILGTIDFQDSSSESEKIEELKEWIGKILNINS